MSGSHADAAPAIPTLVLTDGGPCAKVLGRLRLAPPTGRTRRTAVLLAAATWGPLLALSAREGLATGGADIPFLYDLAAHVRFLLAVPLLVLAEARIGARLRRATAHFVESGLVRDDDRARFDDIVADTIRFRDSRLAGLLVVAAAYLTTYLALARGMRHAGSTWYAPGAGLTPVGYWYGLVALPVFQFLVYRWLYRMLVWARFLRQVATLDLALTPTHPDRAGGLGFLGTACTPFGVLLFALSAVAASAIAARVLFGGGRLEDFQASYAALFVVALVAFAGPSVVFTPALLRLKRRGLHEYGTLANRYAQLFERRWVRGDDPPAEPLLGTGDIQSLADLGTSYEVVRAMRPVPVAAADLVAMTLPGLLPALLLAATVVPVGDIVKGLLRLLA